MNRKPLITAFVFTVTTSAAAILGPRLGEAITPNAGLLWQLLPWGLLAACWVGLLVWMRRARPNA